MLANLYAGLHDGLSPTASMLALAHVLVEADQEPAGSGTVDVQLEPYFAHQRGQPSVQRLLQVMFRAEKRL